MNDLPGDVDEMIRRSAARGARSATSNKQVLCDACEWTLERWADAHLHGKQIANPEAWAFRVGRNAAYRIGGAKRRHVDEVALRAPAEPIEPATGSLSEAERVKLRRQLIRKKSTLIGRQLDVLLKFTEPNMSFHRAAKELAMDRSSLRRSFRSGIMRLRGS